MKLRQHERRLVVEQSVPFFVSLSEYLNQRVFDSLSSSWWIAFYYILYNIVLMKN